MENPRKRTEVKLVKSEGGRYGVEAHIASPDFHSLSIVSEDFIIIQKKQTKITIDKPLYVGMSILDISKVLMYDFHYCKMKTWLGAKAKLLYMDTDSLIYSIHGENIYNVMKEHSEFFDTSNFDENNQFGIERKNKKVPGKFKNENGSEIMTDFIALCAKSYSILVQNEEPVIKVKGVKKNVVKRTITHENFRECLFDKKVVRRDQNTIRSRKHAVHTELQEERVALNFFDDKRYQIPDSTETLPWGHKDIPEEEQVLIEHPEPAELIPQVGELESRSAVSSQQPAASIQQQQEQQILDISIPDDIFDDFHQVNHPANPSPPAAKKARYF